MAAKKSKATKRDIPDPIKREVRQRCGFGCVVCGLPLYEYEHMLGFARVRRHVASEITLLCDRCHKERTNGWLPPHAVREANKNPVNLQIGKSQVYNLRYSGTSCRIGIGGNLFTYSDLRNGPELVALAVDDEPLIKFAHEDGHLLLSLRVYDAFDNPVLEIDRNELRYSVDPWDIELEGRTLAIREGSRKFLIKLTFEPPSGITITHGYFLRNGIEVIIRPAFVGITNNRIVYTGSEFLNSSPALNLEPTVSTRSAVSFTGINRFPVTADGSSRYPEQARRETIRFARQRAAATTNSQSQI